MKDKKFIWLAFITLMLVFSNYQYYILDKKYENLEQQNNRIQSIAYQSLLKLDSDILNFYLASSKDGLSYEELGKINNKILEK